MKILQVIPFLSPNFGGSVTAPCALFKELSKNGHHITILTSNYGYDSNYAKELSKANISVIPFQVNFNIGLFIVSIKMKEWLDNNLNLFDISHLHNFRSYQNNIVHYYSKKYNIPYIVQAHGSLLPISQKQSFKRFYDIVWGNKILKDSVKVIALTKSEALQYQKVGVREEKIEIIPNGLDMKDYEDLPERGTFRSQFDIGFNKKIILYLGRINKIKGIDLLVETFSDLVFECNDIKLVIVGPDDGYLSILKKRISEINAQDKIIYTGPLFGRDKLAAYNDSDIFVLPSTYDAFPTTILEAWACSKPVIVTRECGIAQEVNALGGGVVSRNKIEMKNEILTLLNNDKKRINLGKLGQEKVKACFNLTHLAIEMERVYQKCI